MSETLFIIGNGFDLHHKLKTSYEAFCINYAQIQPYIWRLLKDIYGDKIDKDCWWSDFEKMLGEIDHLHLFQSKNGSALGANKIGNLLNNLPVAVNEWIRHIDVNVKSDPSLGISSDSLYFTFNYTLVLEKTYHIDNDRIWHIHNAINTPNPIENPIVIGPDSDWRQLMDQSRDGIQEISYDTVRQYNEAVLKGAKKVSKRIIANEERFYQYSEIKHFVVMGFSFNDIDMPYINKIVDVNNNKLMTEWTLYWHNEREIDVMKNKLLNIGIQNIEFKKW